MSFPPLHPSSQNDSKSSNQGPARPRQSAWGLPAQSSSRRGLAPLATNVPPSSDLAPRPGSSSSGPSFNNTTASPFAPSFSSVLNSSARLGGSRIHSSTASSSSSPLTPLQTGSQQLPANQLLLSPRSRATTPFSTSNLASSAAASTIASQGGGGGSSGGGGPSRAAAFSPSLSSQGITSPTSSTFERNPFSLSTPSSLSNQSSVSKIVITQVFLLLGSITEKEGKAKWESQAEGIRKLVYSNGMEVYAKFFRRLLSGNSPQIFPGINRNVENPGNYPLLKEEIQKASQDSRQAESIAEIIDTSEGDIFRDFDLVTFISHFNLDPVSQTIFASAFTQVTKQDLRAKAASILSTTFPTLLQTISTVDNAEQDIPAALLATAAFRFLLFAPENIRDGSEKNQIGLALESRYINSNTPIPIVVRSAMTLVDILEGGNELARELMRQGPSAIGSLDSAKEFLRRTVRGPVDTAQIGGLVLFTILTPEAQNYQLENLVNALRELLQSRISWSDVISSFDREGLVVSQSQFFTLYNAFLPIVHDDESFDIQLLWGGKWHNKATQLSFAVSFASLSSDQVDAASIPRFRFAFDPREWDDDIPADYVAFSEAVIHDPMISLDAVAAIIEGLWDPSHSLSQDIDRTKNVVGEKMTLFLSAVGAIAKPWVASHHSLMAKTVMGCILKDTKDYPWLLHCMWKQDKAWLAGRLMDIHSDDPLHIPLLLEHATDHGWLDELCTMMTGFGIDLAAYAHRKGLVDLHQWAAEKLDRNAAELTNALCRFLIIKAQDEMRTMRNEQSKPRTVNLAMRTVYAMLEILQQHMKDQRPQLRNLERNCMQAFPRLCNYGEGFDAVIEANGAESNALPATADAEMQDLYKRMYGGELEVRQVIEVLRECKMSEQADRQELFACMIHGLFDEFICFHEYPLGPLATTAVLFGGIISYRLINNFALNVALEMVLESVREYPPETSMYKFGLQALLHFVPRLLEWPDFVQQIVQIPGLQGTPVWGPAQDALRAQRNQISDTNGDSLVSGQKEVNGHIDELPEHDSLVAQFRSVNVDLPLFPERYEDPGEDVQDKVLFVLNNVSEQNLSSKIHDLIESLEPRHYQWFAAYLVEQRAKSQPNYQSLYLDLLGLLGDRDLWADVLRETYASVRKVLNAESTMKSSIERTHLKNLGAWLGSLTLARDKPIKHKNIAFKELLMEGYETQRLLLTIPFTCEVLAQGAKSVVFKPPNPWIMEVTSVLMELYDLPDLKIQQKFAVEVLLNVFGLPRNGEGLERSSELVKRRLNFDSEVPEPLGEGGLEGFEELSMNNLNRGVRNARFSPTAIASTMPDLSEMLVLPPSSGPNQTRLRQVVLMAVQRSIMEIIGPVVERSVTIATIATKDLVTKDYAQEPDEERLRSALENVAKTTSASLASVTCKEPLRMSITNHIRNAALDMPDVPLPEGAVLMSVNDNLDIACRIVEKQAEERALPEIKAHIDAEIAKRREHKAQYPNESYRDPAFSQWSTYISEPYKLTPGGLNQQQLDIYENFAPQARGISHTQNASTDSGKQIPDVLQESGFPNVPNLSTPAAEPPALPHQPQPQQGHNSLPLLQGIRSPAQVNGFADPSALEEQAYNVLTEMARLAKETPNQRIKNLSQQSAIVELFHRLENLTQQAPDVDAMTSQIAVGTYHALYSNAESRFEVELFSLILSTMCRASNNTRLNLLALVHRFLGPKLLNSQANAALLNVNLVLYPQLDLALSRSIQARNADVLQAFGELLDLVLFNDEPIALRADFSASFAAVAEWLSQQPDFEDAQAIMRKLIGATGLPEGLDVTPDNASRIFQEQMQYIFSEWVALFSQDNTTDSMLVGFIARLYQQGNFKNEEDVTLFLRLSMDTAIESFDELYQESLKQPGVQLSREAHLGIDALARFVVLLVKNQGQVDAQQRSRSQFLEDILSLLVIILNNHHVVRGDLFSQKSWFRLFSSIFYDWEEVDRQSVTSRDDSTQRIEDSTIAFAKTILVLEPQYFPGFAYGWMQLIGHRMFLPTIISNGGSRGLEIIAQILEDMLSFICGLDRTNVATILFRDLYRGALRILLILHHDFPEFLAQIHYRLCSVIPPRCVQLSNLVLSAQPTSMFELPDPFSQGLKVDRMDEIRKAPEIDGDVFRSLRDSKMEDTLTRALRSTSAVDENVGQIVQILANMHEASSLEYNSSILQALVISIAQSALAGPTGSKHPQSFNADSPHAHLLNRLARELRPELRNYLLSAITNQLRYPNSHTAYFSHALLHMFGTDEPDADGTAVRQQIVRVFLDRVIVHRPHPWGLLVTIYEMLKNPAFDFWNIGFIREVPELEAIFAAIFRVSPNGPLA